MSDVIVRVLTLGTHVNAPILSFAAAKLDLKAKEFDPELFEAVLDLTDCEKNGYQVLAADLQVATNLQLLQKRDPDGPLWECLAEFMTWLDFPDPRVWSGSLRSVDDVIRMRMAFDRSSPLVAPWSAFNEFAVSTLYSEFPEVQHQMPLLVEEYDIPPTSLVHEAIYAARWLHTFTQGKT